MRSNIANVLDLELTCYENGVFPAGEQAEIIEFGLTTVDLGAGQILKTYSIPVIPTVSTVSPYCTALTGWTAAKLRRQGVPFAEACRRMAEKYGGRNRFLVTDSSDECEIVRAQCARMDVPYPLGFCKFNVSALFQLLGGLPGGLSLDEMLAAVGMEFEGVRHRGSDDSRNIARLFLALKSRASFKLAE